MLVHTKILVGQQKYILNGCQTGDYRYQNGSWIPKCLPQKATSIATG